MTMSWLILYACFSFVISLAAWAFIRGASDDYKPRVKTSLKVRGEELISNEFLERSLRGDA